MLFIAQVNILYLLFTPVILTLLAA